MYSMKVILNGHYQVRGLWDDDDNTAHDIIEYLNDIEDFINESTYDEIQNIIYRDRIEKYRIEITDITSGKTFAFEFEGFAWSKGCDAFLQAILS